MFYGRIKVMVTTPKIVGMVKNINYYERKYYYINPIRFRFITGSPTSEN